LAAYAEEGVAEQGAEYVAGVGVREGKEAVVMGEEGEGIDRVANFTREGYKTYFRGVDKTWERYRRWSACAFGFRVVHYINLVIVSIARKRGCVIKRYLQNRVTDGFASNAIAHPSANVSA
jgi:hypothetical protein